MLILSKFWIKIRNQIKLMDLKTKDGFGYSKIMHFLHAAFEYIWISKFCNAVLESLCNYINTKFKTYNLINFLTIVLFSSQTLWNSMVTLTLPGLGFFENLRTRGRLLGPQWKHMLYLKKCLSILSITWNFVKILY